MALDLDYATDVFRHLQKSAGVHTVILGAGSNTRLTLGQSDSNLLGGVRAILDDDPAQWGRRLAGIPVRSPDDYPLDKVRRVLIASEMFESELVKRATDLFNGDVEILYTFDRQHSLPSRLGEAYTALVQQWNRPHADDALWYTADRLYSALRTRLSTLTTWRYGPHRQMREFAEIESAIEDVATWPGSTLLNLGCGRYHPLGVSLLALLRGAGRTLALDLEPVLDPARSAQATADLIGEVLLDPASALGSEAPSRSDLLKRLETLLDLEQLSRGDLLGAVRSDALDYRVESIYSTTWPPGSVDVVVSRDVWEHLSDVLAALAVVCRLLRPGGVAFLAIDFSDHRRYQNPRQYAHWSHLADLEEPTFLGTNRLRYPQYPRLFEEAGLEVVRYTPQAAEPLPSHAKSSLAPIYRRMPDDDLAVTRAVAVLRKPPPPTRP